MNINRIKELVKMYRNLDDKEFFASLVVYDTIDFLGELDDFHEGDIEYLENLYKYYIESENLNLLNVNEIIERYEERIR